MFEVSYEFAVANVWIITTLWCFFFGYGAVEAALETKRNRPAYHEWKDSDDVLSRLETLKDYLRSVLFLIGFLLFLGPGLKGLWDLIFFGPPPSVEASLIYCIVLWGFLLGGIAFWGGKHTDRVIAKRINRYVSDHPELFPQTKET